MREHLNADDTINTIRLELRHPAGKKFLWVLVEGETDQKLYAKLIAGRNTKVEMVFGGVENLRKAVFTLVQETKQVLGIRDADFLHLDKRQETIACLFLTDFHDAEMLLLTCDAAFESVVCEYLPLRRADFEMLRRNLLESLVFLGAIRWINNSEILKLNFEGLSLAKVYDAAMLTLDKAKCIEELENRSPNKKRNLQTEEIELKINGFCDHYNLCNGHDFEKAFALHINVKNPGVKGVKDGDIGKALRMAYRKDDFATTKLYESLKNWESETGYVLF
jgi:hypothetical protein